MPRFEQIVGLSGVNRSENASAKRWGARFERVLIIIALLILLQWYAESTGGGWLVDSHLIDWIIWIFFLIELLVLTCLVTHRGRYLRGNWMNLLIVITGLPLLWQSVPLSGGLRALRLILFIGLLPRVSKTARVVLSRNKLGHTLIVVALFVLFSGLLLSSIDPAFDSPGDGIWWALVTVTTVGYGDIVPISAEGRILAGVLMVMGVMLLAMLTANVAAFLIDSDMDKEQVIIVRKLAQIEERLDRIETTLESLPSNDRKRGKSNDSQ